MTEPERYASNNSESLVNSATDELLVELSRCGQHSAYAELCRRHSRQVFNAILRITRNREDAEDVLQESLLRAFCSLDSFESRSSFSTWLHRIAMNSAFMLLRKKGRRQMESIDEVNHLGNFNVPELAEKRIGVEQMIIECECLRRLNNAVNSLPPSLKIVISLRRSGDAIKEIASTLGISRAATKSRLGRAKQRLRASLV